MATANTKTQTETETDTLCKGEHTRPKLIRRSESYCCEDCGQVYTIDTTSYPDFKAQYETEHRKLLNLEASLRDLESQRTSSSAGLHSEVRSLRDRLQRVVALTQEAV